MSAPVRTDALSLTLPKAGSRKRTWRRPKLPRDFWWFLFWTVWCIGWAIQAALMAAGAAFYWRCTMRAKDGRSYPSYVFGWFAVVYFLAFVVLLTAGVA